MMIVISKVGFWLWLVLLIEPVRILEYKFISRFG